MEKDWEVRKQKYYIFEKAGFSLLHVTNKPATLQQSQEWTWKFYFVFQVVDKIA